MATMLHGSARTTPRIRAELQRSKEKTSILAQRYGLSRTTVTKWRSRTTTTDAPIGPSQPKSTVLSPAEEAVIVEFRRKTLLPLPAASVSFKGQDNWRCREFNTKMVGFVGTQPALTYIVVTAAWDAYVTESSGYKLRTGGGNSATSLTQGIEALAHQLQTDGTPRQLIVVGQVPTYDWGVPLKMALSQMRGDPITPLMRNDWRAKSAVSRTVFEQSASARRIAFIESADWFCAAGTCRYAHEQGQPLYWDHGHVSAAGARFIAPMLERKLRSRLFESAP